MNRAPLRRMSDGRRTQIFKVLILEVAETVPELEEIAFKRFCKDGVEKWVCARVERIYKDHHVFGRQEGHGYFIGSRRYDTRHYDRHPAAKVDGDEKRHLEQNRRVALARQRHVIGDAAKDEDIHASDDAECQQMDAQSEYDVSPSAVFEIKWKTNRRQRVVGDPDERESRHNQGVNPTDCENNARLFESQFATVHCKMDCIESLHRQCGETVERQDAREDGNEADRFASAVRLPLDCVIDVFSVRLRVNDCQRYEVDAHAQVGERHIAENQFDGVESFAVHQEHRDDRQVAADVDDDDEPDENPEEPIAHDVLARVEIVRWGITDRLQGGRIRCRQVRRRLHPVESRKKHERRRR